MWRAPCTAPFRASPIAWVIKASMGPNAWHMPWTEEYFSPSAASVSSTSGCRLHGRGLSTLLWVWPRRWPITAGKAASLSSEQMGSRVKASPSSLGGGGCCRIVLVLVRSRRTKRYPAKLWTGLGFIYVEASVTLWSVKGDLRFVQIGCLLKSFCGL